MLAGAGDAWSSMGRALADDAAPIKTNIAIAVFLIIEVLAAITLIGSLALRGVDQVR